MKVIPIPPRDTYLVSVIFLLLVGCNPSANVVQEEYTFGAVLPLTGPASYIGQGNLRGIEIAVAQINSMGGVNGKPIHVHVEDSQSSPKQGLTAYHSLESKINVPVLYSTLTSVSFAIAPHADEDNKLILAQSAHPHIANQENAVVRNFFTANDASESLIEYLKDQNFNSLLLFYINDEAGLGAAEYLEEIAPQNNIELIEAVPFERTETDFSTLVLKSRIDEADAILVFAYGSAQGILTKDIAAMYPDVPRFHFLICGDSSVHEAAGESIESTYGIEAPIDPTIPEYQEFLRLYANTYGTQLPNHDAFLAYDAVFMIKQGLESNQDVQTYIRTQRHEGIVGNVAFDGRGNAQREMEILLMKDSRCVQPSEQ